MSGDSSLAALAAELILEHARNPIGRVLVSAPHPASPSGLAERQARGYSPSCGDEVVVSVGMAPEGLVASLRWTGHGCVVSQASASMLAAFVETGLEASAGASSPIPAAVVRARSLELVAAAAPGGDALDEGEFGDAAVLGGGWLSPQRARCAALAWTAMCDALGEA